MLFSRKEPLGGCNVTPFAQEKVDGSTLLIDGAIEVDPLAFDFDVGFIHTPGVADWPCVMIPALFKLRDILLHPPKNSRMGQSDAALGHHLDKVAGAEFKGQVPPHAQQMSVEDLRAWLEIEEHALPSVKNLRKRAIDVSKAELDKKADLTFTYKPTKTGRRITGWTFKVKKNQPRPVQRQLPQRDHEPDHTPEVKAKGLGALAVCKREVAETAPPVARITRGSRV